MKKLASFLAILAIVLFSYCSKIKQNDDPIIGIWVEAVSSTTSTKSNSNTRVEWIFNDVYLGRYHEFSDGQIVVQSDFSWSQNDGTYTIEYVGLENKLNDIVTIENTANGTLLQQKDGNMLAIRE